MYEFAVRIVVETDCEEQARKQLEKELRQMQSDAKILHYLLAKGEPYQFAYGLKKA